MHGGRVSCACTGTGVPPANSVRLPPRARPSRPVTGAVNVLSGEGLSLDGLYGTGRLFVTELGEEVIVYVAGTTGVVTRLSDGVTIDAFELGATTGSYVASPVLLADGSGDADALLFVATDNTVTIVPDTGLYEDTDAPWPGPRRDPRMQATLP